MSDFSEIEEMYLKTMFEIHSDNPAAIVKTTQLADIKGVSAASVTCLLYTSPSPRDKRQSRMPSSA